MFALCQSEGLSANARNVSFETLNGGQFTLSTQLMILSYLVVLSTVSLETYPRYTSVNTRTSLKEKETPPFGLVIVYTDNPFKPALMLKWVGLSE